MLILAQSFVGNVLKGKFNIQTQMMVKQDRNKTLLKY